LRSFAAENPQTVESDRENFVLARARNGFMRRTGVSVKTGAVTTEVAGNDSRTRVEWCAAVSASRSRFGEKEGWLGLISCLGYIEIKSRFWFNGTVSRSGGKYCGSAKP
jgi:hypothetical protein